RRPAAARTRTRGSGAGAGLRRVPGPSTLPTRTIEACGPRPVLVAPAPASRVVDVPRSADVTQSHRAIGFVMFPPRTQAGPTPRTGWGVPSREPLGVRDRRTAGRRAPP